MIRVVRTNAENQDFMGLVKLLDAELAIKDGDDHAFYAQFNKIDRIKYAVVVYENDRPLGCGAIKEYDPEAMEVKRMYVSLESRGRGIASSVLMELEKWADELGYKRCVLETGKKQPEAVALYKRCGYKIIPNYGQYVDVENSLCFGKQFNKK